jgi:hypothetical protein
VLVSSNVLVGFNRHDEDGTCKSGYAMQKSCVEGEDESMPDHSEGYKLDATAITTVVLVAGGRFHRDFIEISSRTEK